MSAPEIPNPQPAPPPPPIGFPPAPFPMQVPVPMFIPPPPPRGGFARAIFTTLAVLILTGSITLNGYLLIFAGLIGSGDGTTVKKVLNEGDALNTIAVLPLSGMIEAQSADRFLELIKDVETDGNVKAIVIEMNTPGGTVTASDEIYARLIAFRRTTGKPVIVSMRDMGTSGGYYIACGADRIFAEPTTWTANIGVLLPRISLAKLGEKYGIEDQTVVATGATFKNAGSLFKDDSPEQVAYWQGLADQAFDVFKNVVMQGRKLDAATVNKLADGQVRTGIDALKLKLIDDVGYLDDAIGAAEKQAGLTKARVLRYERHPSFFEALAGGSSSSKSQMVQAKVGGIDLGVDQNVLQHLMSSRPMYLWRGQ